MRKLLGYRLKDEKYREAVQKIILCLDEINVNSIAANELKQAGVMHWFEEVYDEEDKLEVGKWYKVTNLQNGCLGFKGIGMYTEEILQSGLDERENGYNLKEPNGRVWRVNGRIEPATPEEIQQALIKEAKKRGFKDKSRITDVDNDSELIDFSSPNYSSRANWFELGCAVVFRDGKWAEILPTETLNGKTAIIDGVEYELKIK